MGVLLFIVAILIVIMIHEAGHLVVAKIFGFKATKFFVGFGPPLWSFKRGETEYGIAAIPAGGFVKIVGMNPYEEVAPEDEARSYPNKPRWQRALVLVAGSATHWMVAFVILVVAFMTIGLPTGLGTNQLDVVEKRVEGEPAPAAVAGLEPGDRIVAIDGAQTGNWTQVRNAIRSNPGRTLELTVRNAAGDERDVVAHLGTAYFGADDELLAYTPPGAPIGTPPPDAVDRVGFLGVQPTPEYETLSFPAAVVDGGGYVVDLTARSFRGVGEMFGMVFGGELWDALTGDGERAVDEGPLGIVGAGRIASQTVDRGDYLNFVGLVVGFTVFVGLMNLLPLPPLDGGHLAVLLWEKITGRAVDIRKLIPIAAAVISFFVILFVAVLYLDLARPIQTPF